MTLDRPEAAKEYLERREVRSSLVAWAKFYAERRKLVPAQHHLLMLDKLQQATDGTLIGSNGKVVKYLIISMPPGAAKSFYASVVFPVWFIQKRKGCRILACSHSADLIESFSRDCRNAVDEHHNILGYNLRPDSRAVQEWMTDNDGAYRCAGVGAGIAGRRADAGIIDDYIGSQEDADSKLIRNKVWNWYLSDFWPRLKPGALQIIIATRWHEEDLIGRLTDPNNAYNAPTEPSEWEVIRFPFFAEEGDVLGRAVGDRLWPEWFTPHMAEGVKRLPSRVQSGLYQQRPSPEEGSYFQRDWLRTYNHDEYDKLMVSKPRIYAAGDWACSNSKDANKSCFGGVARDEDGVIYFLPDLFWKVADPKEVVTAFMLFLKRREPLQTWSEKGHISKSWGPFLRDVMVEENVYSYITEVTPAHAKDVRARSIQGMMSMGRIKFPAFASWWPDAQHELLSFPGGKSDDFVDFIAHIGMGLGSIIKTIPRRVASVYDLANPRPLTWTYLKQEHKKRESCKQTLYAGR